MSLHLFVVLGRNNKNLLCFKTDCFFQSNNSCDSKSLLPFHLSPFPESNQPSFSGPCASCCLLVMFFPVLIIIFSFSAAFVRTYSGEEWSGDGYYGSLYFLSWSETISHWRQTKASANKNAEGFVATWPFPWTGQNHSESTSWLKLSFLDRLLLALVYSGMGH